ncbi:Ssl1-like-domain-containing protein [Piptocephalis cylindrospora]|uniref:General transcription and DNA repair factor IIH n=1 Tax=Piptocephalis cylindrospora TaxID=1907219 RepID=A0A4P9Y027_9FUNG|nr:Ssl1-like-domain-containing protein [Piptocephalis cylindrospora]|eukprot:RKP12103.1 Ssl1-like-domain-containing protein [Piptocephalis cylindrospora]
MPQPPQEDPLELIDVENDDATAVAPSGYVWEEEYKRSWDVLQEDASGSLASAIKAIQQQREHRRLTRDTSTVQRGIIRHLLIVLDASTCMAEVDLRPNRMQLVENGVAGFIGEFFDQNPLSQLGTLVLRDGIAQKLTDLGGNPGEHVRAVQQQHRRGLSGEPSLQNALGVCRSLLRHVPHHGSKEVLIFLGSLTSCDPGDINETIDTLVAEGIRVSVIGLAAEVQVCRTLAARTNGSYAVVMNETHFKDLLLEHVIPPATTQKGADSASSSADAGLVHMGFPRRIAESTPSLCACHHLPRRGGYICPRCGVKVCDIPQDCRVCGLTLVSSPHLARSYHHLFPIPNFLPIAKSLDPGSACFACQTPLTSSSSSSFHDAPLIHPDSTPAWKCPNCDHHYCTACDLFIHDILHNCPGCTS